jgi:hypothetical protein
MPFLIGSLCINCLSDCLDSLGGEKNPRALCVRCGGLMTLIGYLSKRPTPRSNKDENKEVNEAHY